jgi:MATE family multidrug resistance protein
VALLVPLVPVVVVMQPLNAAVFVWDGVYLGARRFWLVAVFMVSASLVALAVLFLVLPMGWGLNGVWAGLVVFMTARFVLMGGGHLAGAHVPIRSREEP